MNDRNLKSELQYHYYEDMERGGTEETIDFDLLIDLLKEILTRIEKLEENQNNV